MASESEVRSEPSPRLDPLLLPRSTSWYSSRIRTYFSHGAGRCLPRNRSLESKEPAGAWSSACRSAQQFSSTTRVSVAARSAVAERACIAEPARTTSQRPKRPPTCIIWRSPAQIATWSLSSMPSTCPASLLNRGPSSSGATQYVSKRACKPSLTARWAALRMALLWRALCTSPWSRSALTTSVSASTSAPCSSGPSPASSSSGS
mmetsp:Transcript_12676/g.36722  ORF Transcript_12676/g.36722 Transcript_12676/m.36722 type:complete len:205 (-) Transcript_12676:784-1398(-)